VVFLGGVSTFKNAIFARGGFPEKPNSAFCSIFNSVGGYGVSGFEVLLGMAVVVVDSSHQENPLGSRLPERASTRRAIPFFLIPPTAATLISSGSILQLVLYLSKKGI
jgi:hypothetical protein